MLARLDTLYGKGSAHVDATGRSFVIDLDPTASDDAAAPALEVLGRGARVSHAPWDESLRESLAGGADLWLTSTDIARLSRLEAQILSRRLGSAAARAASLDPEAADHLIDLLRRELDAVFEQIHAAGGTSDPTWYRTAFPPAFDRALDRLGLDGVRAAAREALIKTLG